MGLLDSIGEGLTYISKDAKEDRAYERELGQAEKKARLAMKLEEEFAARKYELAQKYPEMKSTINNNAGTIFGVMSDNSLLELNKNQALEDAVISGKAAPAERVNLLEQRVPYQNRLDEARAEAEPVKAGAAATNAAANTTRAETSTEEKPMTEAQQRANISKATALVMKEAQDNYEDDLSEEEIQARVAAKLAQQDALLGKVATAQGAGMAPVAGVPEASDNPFAKYQKQ